MLQSKYSSLLGNSALSGAVTFMDPALRFKTSVVGAVLQIPAKEDLQKVPQFFPLTISVENTHFRKPLTSARFDKVKEMNLS